MNPQSDVMIATTTDLLTAMVVPFQSNMTSATLYREPNTYVTRYFDDGSNRSNAFSAQRVQVTPEVFEAACRKAFICRCDPDHDWKYEVTPHGSEESTFRNLLLNTLLVRNRGVSLTELEEVFDMVGLWGLPRVLADLEKEGLVTEVTLGRRTVWYTPRNFTFRHVLVVGLAHLAKRYPNKVLGFRVASW